MVTKQQAVEFAKGHGWTETDAKRAYNDLDFKIANNDEILLSLIDFAGVELIARQRSQAGFKGAVTKKNNEIAQISQEYHDHIVETKQKLEELQSRFLPVIEKIYSFAKPLGLNDPWVEAMLKLYNEKKKA